VEVPSERACVREESEIVFMGVRGRVSENELWFVCGSERESIRESLVLFLGVRRRVYFSESMKEKREK